MVSHDFAWQRRCTERFAKIEYLVVAFDDKEREVKLSLRQADILEALASDPELIKQGGGVPDLNEGIPKYATVYM